MSEEEQWISVIQAHCRDTGYGAETSLYITYCQKGHAKVRRYNVSKTGNHWEEELLVSPDFTGIVALKDISNTGKHRCMLFYIHDGKVTSITQPEEFYWHIKCPVCHEIHKYGGRKKV